MTVDKGIQIKNIYHMLAYAGFNSRCDHIYGGFV